MSGVRSQLNHLRRVSYIIAVLIVACSYVYADEQLAQRKVDAHLDAGEFGVALNLARQVPEASQRDFLFARIAVAQANNGAREASLHTASSIRSDRQRSDALNSLGRIPLFSGARGGAALADFDTLIEMIKSTVSPDSWDDNGGVGAVEPFAGGVYVDSTGTLQRLTAAANDSTLLNVRRTAVRASGNRDVRETSPLRKVSLVRLERQAQLEWAKGRHPDETMRVLAGLTRVQYLLIYPETGDIVLAGPAENWNHDAEGRFVGVESGRPLLQLDDLVVVLRNAFQSNGRFGCSINPRRENLASVKEFLDESSGRSLKPGEQDRWLSQLRDRLGPQDIEVTGIDPGTRAARVLVEADYRMKLVGMGLETGTLGVTSYLDSLGTAQQNESQAMDVLRWWFTLNYESIRTTETRDAFELLGPGVKVLSENELLTERGERVHTGQASNQNRQFTQSFTRHFEDLATKYPIYAELRNIFDLALLTAVIREEDLGSRCDWHQTFFGSTGTYPVESGTPPKQVESVINHRLFDRKHLVIGVSGGVAVDTSSYVQPSFIKRAPYRLLSSNHSDAAPPELATDAWWWD